jgi:hypothetical protein
MAKITQRTVIGLKTATDFMLASDVQVDPNPDVLLRDYQRATISPMSSLIGKKWVQVTFKTAVKASGSRGTVYAPLSAALQACGLVETISAGVSVIYAPTSIAASASFYGAGKSCSILVNYDGILWSLTGALGECKLVGDVGKPGMYEFTFKAVYAEPADVALPTATYLSAVEPTFINGSVTIQGLAPTLTKAELAFGNVITQRDSVNAVTGVLGFQIVDRRPTFSFDPEMEMVASHNFLNKLMSGTEAAYTFAFGSTAGQITTVSGTKLQYKDAKPGDRSGLRTYAVECLINAASGDDEFQIAQS